MKPSDAYLKIVEWSDEDQIYIGTCPDLFPGGCHGDDSVAVYAELCELVERFIEDELASGRALPPIRTRPCVVAAEMDPALTA